MQHADWEREFRRQRNNGAMENDQISKRMNKTKNKEERGENKEVMDRFYITFSSRKMIVGENGVNQELQTEQQGQPIRSQDGMVGTGHWIAP